MPLAKAPAPTLILSGVMRTLRESVMPHVSDSHVQTQLGMLCALLERLRDGFDCAAKELVAEIEQLEALLGAGAAALRGAGAADAAQPLETLVGTRCLDLAVSALAERSDQLQEALYQVALSAESGDPVLGAFRPRIRAALDQLSASRRSAFSNASTRE